jgi:phosphoadenosine phosphosulfate reductase
MSAKKAKAAKPPKPAPPHPLEVIRRARDSHQIKQVCVGVSGGKDSVACLSVCIDAFGAANVFPFFMYICPDLSFQTKYLAYLERLFGISIVRLPHWLLSQLYRGGSFRHQTRKSQATPRLTIRDIESHVRKLSGFEWVADGSKAIDSLERNAMIRNVKGISGPRRKLWPLAYWSHEQVYAYLKQRGIALAPDYSGLTKRSFGGLWMRDLFFVRERYPEDWEKIKASFPLIEAQVARYELRAKRLGKTIEEVAK